MAAGILLVAVWFATLRVAFHVVVWTALWLAVLLVAIVRGIIALSTRSRVSYRG